MRLRRFTHPAAVLLAIGLALLVGAAADAQTTQWAATRTGAYPISGAQFQDVVAPDELIDIVIPLKPRNKESLDKKVLALITPGSPEFRQYLSHAQVIANYVPFYAQAQRVADYLAQMGFPEVEIADSNLLVKARGPAAAVRHAFNTELAHYARAGRVGIVNTTPVQIPAELTDVVDTVLGLQTLDLLKTSSVGQTAIDAGGFPALYGLTGIYKARQPTPVRVPFSTGANTVVGIITEGNVTQVLADLKTAETQQGLQQLTPTVLNVNGTGPFTDTSNAHEWDIDSQATLGVASQLAGMIFYNIGSLTDANLTLAIEQAVGSNAARIINMSFGGCEWYFHADNSLGTDDYYFELATAQGQTFVASSGDTGSNDCSDYGPNGAVGQEYPAASPYVIAVGGTSTYVSFPLIIYVSETGWSGSGGGPSTFESMPSWQSGIVPAGGRGVPDIAFDADPNSGIFVIVGGVQQQWGGTSLAAPLFVGSYARMETAVGNTFGFPGAALYSVGKSHPTDFYDVTSGSNGKYSATAGWDYVTGFGRPLLRSLVNDL
jgi:pseudomonalisin/xanthomonalisin